jgi:hypothetical protein
MPTAACLRMFMSLSTSVGLLLAGAAAAEETPFTRTEARERCANYDPLRQPFYGDTHVHTRYSFDSYVSSQRNDPWDAYRYAKGEPITLPAPDGTQTLTAQIQRPLDYTAVTDHAEYLGEINLCTQDSSELGYWWPHCMMTRSDHFWTQLLAANWWVTLGVTGNRGERSFVCSLSDCSAAADETWSMIQRAADDHYDRSAECSFTSFVGYEYTDAPDHNNLHRNVIFRNEHVTPKPISTYDTGTRNFPELWKQLRQQCIDAGTGCDVLAIPHNPNLSGGLMFPDPKTRQEAEDRLFFEPLIELVQHKASSECRYDRLEGRGLDTEDELCDFEQAVSDNLSMLGTVGGEVRTDRAAPVPLDEFGRRNMARNTLKDGLALGQESGINPFQFGFVGASDTHSATPGGVEEDNYMGHLGRRDAGYRNVQDHFYDNPGGHGVVWAEENSRDAIFEAMRRRETYATSGTRPTVRFFGGWDFEPELCGASDAVAQGYARGVPMGGELSNATAAAPSFLVSAMKDPGSAGHPGTDLQRIQIIKGWVGADGATHEKVYDVAGDPANGAGVDPDTCAPSGSGFSDLCSVWNDPEFDATQPAFYYVRVLENPSCRWSTHQCQAAGVNPFSARCSQQAASVTAKFQEDGASGDVWGNCCIDPKDEPFYTPTVQERAWTSPIWFTPGS